MNIIHMYYLDMLGLFEKKNNKPEVVCFVVDRFGVLFCLIIFGRNFNF